MDKLTKHDELLPSNSEILKAELASAGRVIVTFQLHTGLRVSGYSDEIRVNGEWVWVKQPSAKAMIPIRMSAIDAIGINSTLGI